jgi:3-oxoacyl-[acyl-carrier protein] reductase
MHITQSLAVVFGGTGSIGQAIVKELKQHFAKVLIVSRSSSQGDITWDGQTELPIHIIKKHSIHAVVWAQGTNFSDNIDSLDMDLHRDMYEANVGYILKSLQALLQADLLAPSARLCVISSIWQNLARQNKLSYSITKAALQGLVNSLSVDLGTSGILINAVLPGAIDTPMTHKNLTIEQIESIKKESPLGTLATLDDVAKLVYFLCSDSNRGITGQFIAADRGFSHARVL